MCIRDRHNVSLEKINLVNDAIKKLGYQKNIQASFLKSGGSNPVSYTHLIILGAGQVGTTLAANLVSEDNDITLVDNESQHLQNLQDKHDLRVVKGSPSSPKVLRDAGAADADLMVAVTASDEINMIACQLGYTLFNTPTRIARIRNAEYLREKDKLFNDENVPIDHLISPENLVTDEITRLIAYPGALQAVSYTHLDVYKRQV